MLTEREEQRVDHYIHISSNNEITLHYDQTNAAFKWLALKLKETNDECSKVHEELYKANQYSANLIDRYEGMY